MIVRRLLALTAVLLCCGAFAGRVSAGRPAKGCNVIFIGNSITYGARHADRSRTAPPVVAAARVARITGCGVEFRNCGRSGATTVDFLPERDADFRRVEQAAAELREMNGRPAVFSIMLGTNDSASTAATGAPVSDEDYGRNLMAIIGRLREICPGAVFVLQRPIWYSPNTYNGAMYLVAGQRRLAGYAAVLERLAAENDDIYMGDTEGYDYFRRHCSRLFVPEEGNAGTFFLHPNEKGSRKLGRLWAKAIAAALDAAGY